MLQIMLTCWKSVIPSVIKLWDFSKDFQLVVMEKYHCPDMVAMATQKQFIDNFFQFLRVLYRLPNLCGRKRAFIYIGTI